MSTSSKPVKISFALWRDFFCGEAKRRFTIGTDAQVQFQISDLMISDLNASSIAARLSVAQVLKQI